MGSHMETDALVHYKSTYAEANQLESKVNHQNKQRKLNTSPPRLTPNQNQLEKQRKPKNFSSAYAETSQLGIEGNLKPYSVHAEAKHNCYGRK